MSEPTVCCVMLVNGRPEMVKRAIRSFREQTYSAKTLLLFDTGESPCRLEIGEALGLALGPNGGMQAFYDGGIVHLTWPVDKPETIGSLRNMANTSGARDIICHFDSDDWSHPRRIEEQIALLQASGKQCVGYRDMLFWRGGLIHVVPGKPTVMRPGEAWLYSNNDPRYCLGTSLCYWRRVWEERPFPDLPRTFTAGRLKGKSSGNAEDLEWLRGVDSLGVSSAKPRFPSIESPGTCEDPRMIASIHEGNTQDYSGDLTTSNSWRRVPEWDEHCAKVMAL